MSDYVTHEELGELMQGLLSGVEEIMNRAENRIMMRIENGLGVQVQAQGEKLDAVEKRLTTVEDHIVSLTERVESIDQRLSVVQSDVKEIKARLDLHGAEIYALKRIK